MCGHDTTEIVLPYKLGRFVQSGLLNTILEVKISNVLDLPSVFLRMEMFKYKSLFIFRITQNYTFYCKSDKIKLCESLNYCLFG